MELRGGGTAALLMRLRAHFRPHRVGAPPAARGHLPPAQAWRRPSPQGDADIGAGQPFTVDNIRSIRPSFGLPPKYLPTLLKAKAKRHIMAGERIAWDLVEGLETRHDN